MDVRLIKGENQMKLKKEQWLYFLESSQLETAAFEDSQQLWNSELEKYMLSMPVAPDLKNETTARCEQQKTDSKLVN